MYMARWGRCSSDLDTDMTLRKFLLDVAIGDVKDRDRKEERFAFHDINGDLRIWAAHKDHSGSTILRVFTEGRAGTEVTMNLQDLSKVELPIKIIGLESNGNLLADTGQGLLHYSCKNNRIIGLAGTVKRYREQQDTDQIVQHIRFPGMQQSDCYCCGNLIISRHETIAHGVYGEPFFSESLLLVSQNSSQNEKLSIEPWIAIGNSQIDSNLNLFKCRKKNLFDIPIINFVISRPGASGSTLLIGWNRTTMQVLSVKSFSSDPRSISTQSEDIIKLESNRLEDASTAFLNCQGRSAAWRDMLNPELFFTWRHEHPKHENLN
jgi:hypothetical protein